MKIIENEKILTAPCLDSAEDEAFPIIDLLDSALKKAGGIGLAANQIGILRKVCIVRVPTKESYVIGHNFVNPRIVKLEQPVFFNEGCLSYPGKHVITLRYNKIIVKDLLEPNGRVLTGLEAICCQHETDHTNSKTMYMSKLLKANGKYHLSSIDNECDCPCQSGQQFAKCCSLKIKQFEF